MPVIVRERVVNATQGGAEEGAERRPGAAGESAAQGRGEATTDTKEGME